MCPDGLIAYIYHPLKRWLELTSSIVLIGLQERIIPNDTHLAYSTLDRS